jgi:flagellin-like protein
MKANQKFVKRDDEAVSPVIAVILMVAITVVLAATVYVWVSGFGSSSSSAAKTVSLTSAAAISNDGKWKNYTIASATSGLKYSDFSMTLNGAALTASSALNSCADPVLAGATSQFTACRGTTVLTLTGASASVVQAGDIITVYSGTGGSTMSGATLRLLDSQANSVMATLTIG